MLKFIDILLLFKRKKKPICKTNSNGAKEWYLNGKLHREDGPAVENSYGYKKWLLNGEPHREDGPAIEYPDGAKEWFLNGKYHREDGPAYEGSNGTKEWWLNDKSFSKEEWFEQLTEEQQEKALFSSEVMTS